jgi:hypothetical protein
MKYFVSFVFSKDGDTGYGNTIVNVKRFVLEEMSIQIRDFSGYDNVVILNFIKMK